VIQAPVGTADGGASPGLWLVRHGRPLLPDGVCYGALDVAADPQHTAQIAAMLGERLPLGAELRSSPRQRCMALARAVVALRSDLTLRTEPRIAEMDFGQWEGWRWDDIPRHAFDAWTGQFADHRFGGAESVQDLMHRVGQAWDEARAATSLQLWITHAGVMSAATLLARGVRSVHRAQDWPASSARHGELLSLVDSADGSVAPGRA
jgi:alpha-ribazole phosphatase